MSLAKLTQILSTTAVLAFMATQGVAQETAPATPEAAPAEGLSMGTDANAQAAAAPAAMLTKETAQVGQAYLAGTFELWEQRCEKTADGNDPCQLFQLLKDSSGNAVSEFSIFALPAGSEAVAGATILAPLETLLTANLTIAIDSSKAKVYPFTFCAEIGCVARVGFTAEEVAQFKKGAKATMTIVRPQHPPKKSRWISLSRALPQALTQLP